MAALVDQLVEQLNTKRAFIELAESLMKLHGLAGWAVNDTSGEHTDRRGACNHYHQTLDFDVRRALTTDEEYQRDLILHEIAHALVPARCSHNERWASKAEQIGVRLGSVLLGLAGAAVCHKATAYERAQSLKALRKRMILLSKKQIAALRTDPVGRDMIKIAETGNAAGCSAMIRDERDREIA